MGYTAAQVIAIAKSQVGYLEKASNYNLDSTTGNAGYSNYTKYARDFDQKWTSFYNGKKQSAEWCDMFNDWCHVMAAGGDPEAARAVLCQPARSAGAGCYYSAQYYKAAGRWGSAPQLGAQIFFRDFAHTGLVYAYDATYVYTIEGNTSSASGVVSNGGGVAMKSYRRTSADIDGYGYPKYTTSGESTTTVQEAAPAKKLSYFYPYRKWQNGSTKEIVYKDSDLAEAVGSLSPYEACWCTGRYGDAWCVLYKVDGYADRWAVGYVGYNGGIED